MSILTKELLQSPLLQSPLLTSIIGAAVAFILSIMKTKYSSLREKNKYLNLLKTEFPHIKAFLDTNKQLNMIKGPDFLIYIVGMFTVVWMENILDSPRMNGNSFFSFIIILIFIIAVYVGWCKLIESMHLLNPKLNEKCEFGTVQSIIYISYMFFIGNMLGLALSIIPSRQFVHQFPRTLFVIVPALLVTIYFLFDMRKKIRFFERNVINLPNDYHKSNFPFLKIKTVSGVAKGQLIDISNKSTITLADEDKFNFVPWEKIVIIEAFFQNKDEERLTDAIRTQSSQSETFLNQKAIEAIGNKKAWWQFW